MAFTNNSRKSVIPNPNINNLSHDYQISLNFLPVNGILPSFTVYRKLRSFQQESRPREDVKAYKLPSSLDKSEEWLSYWVSIEEISGFESFQVSSDLQSDLTRGILYWSLKSATRRIQKPEHFFIPENSFMQEISFIQQIHAEGKELLIVQPYYLKATRQFGYLFDFHFHLDEGITFSRKVQQLSLSLDSGFRRNLDYYVDRYTKVKEFVRERQDVLGSLLMPDGKSKILLANESVVLPADRLKTKTYIFAGNRESKSQFIGLRDHGPLKPLTAPPRFFFIFREQDRQAARTLAINLRGNTQHARFTFPGFGALFKCEIEIDGDPFILPDLSRKAIESALDQVQRNRLKKPNLLPILVLPTNDDSYLVQKAVFSHAEIATQVCTLRILQDEDSLKWAIANIALQIFCKAGGYPWKVRPTSDRSLIIGISQSHKTHSEDGKLIISKYFAFSVMTDSSGLFQKIQVLGEDEKPKEYLAKLRENLKKALRESAGQFSRVVVHTSFKLKYDEIDAIQQVVVEAASDPLLSDCKFAVVKVNHRSRFFGVNRSLNSLVPYEATRVKLGPREYLIWFEGIFPDNPTVTKAFPGPTHLQIMRTSHERGISDDILLQDLVNLSGSNWRGFNAKSAPVSVFYCHLVADLVHRFNEHGLPMPAVKDIRPWFL